MTSTTRKLRELMASGEHFIAADVYSALTGRIVERIGFKACYAGGHAMGSFHYALPDISVYSQVEQIEQTARIAAAISIPLIVDADTLGETIADAFHYARRYVRAGIAGVHVEDEVNPKHTTYKGGLTPIPDMQERLLACARGRGDGDLVIIARCDELFTSAARGGGAGSVQEAIKRGKAYAEAGADALVYPGMTPEHFEQLANAITGIPICSMGPTTPGTAFTLSTGWGAFGAAQLHHQMSKALFETGAVEYPPPLEGKHELDVYDALVETWVKKTGRELSDLPS